MAPAEFGARMEQLIAQIKSVPLVEGYDEVFFPGEIENRRPDQDVELPEKTLADLAALGQSVGVMLEAA